ncbi:hypothetical protein SDC9_121892 [bioreactor metagenome]|uniref:Uncharacterized protein n=1 Tax=bioreactor metagenome TaxID=1076179 RepID=A0A645CDB6_9ZZZZ
MKSSAELPGADSAFDGSFSWHEQFYRIESKPVEAEADQLFSNPPPYLRMNRLISSTQVLLFYHHLPIPVDKRNGKLKECLHAVPAIPSKTEKPAGLHSDL